MTTPNITRAVARVNADTVTILVLCEGIPQEHVLPWALLKAAATQEDGELRPVYAELYKAAQQQLGQLEHQEAVTRFWALLTDRVARIAAAVDHTKTGGSVLGQMSACLLTAEGGWPETEQAWRRLCDAVGAAAPKAGEDAVVDAAHALVNAALAAGWSCHPSRR